MELPQNISSQVTTHDLALENNMLERDEAVTFHGHHVVPTEVDGQDVSPMVSTNFRRLNENVYLVVYELFRTL